MAKRKAPTIGELFELRWEMESVYGNWHANQDVDAKLYNVDYSVDAGNIPSGFKKIRTPSATTIIDLTADHAAGNFPNLHVPRRKLSGTAQDKADLMENAGQGFWYRTIQQSGENVLRVAAQSGALRGAVCFSLLYNADALADLPLPSEYGGTESEDYKEAKEEAVALRKSQWPFELRVLDPRYVYPDPASEGRDWTIYAGTRYVYEILRTWPNWDRMIPGRTEPLKLTDIVEYLFYGDDTYRAYGVGGTAPKSGGVALGRGVVKHGYGFNPIFFGWGGFGSPFGKPEHKGRGIITAARDLLETEAVRLTHLNAIVAQSAFPWVFLADGVEPSMEFMGVTRVPTGMKVSDAIHEQRPVVPIEPIAAELQLLRAAIQRATIPDSLGAEPNKSEESGYLRSLKISTGRSRIRALSNTIERAVAWGTAGFYRLVENKVRGDVSVWGAGMPSEREFVTIGPDDIKGHYEVYASLAPNLPQDESVDIRNGSMLYDRGAIPIRDLLETYAGRENASELLRERVSEDVLKSDPYIQKLVAESMGVTNVSGGPIATPGFASGLQAIPGANGPTGMPPAAGVPTPPSPPSATSQMENVVGRTQRGGLPVGAPNG